MKRTIANLMYSVLVSLTLVGIGSIACFGQVDRGAGRLAGTWDAVVTIRDCATGNPIPNLTPFPSIANFNQGGTFLGSTSGRPQSSRTPEHGVWRHVTGNMYEFKFKSFNFDSMGIATGYTIIRHDLELSDSATDYVSAGEARTYLLNGTLVGQGCSSGVGTRFGF